PGAPANAFAGNLHVKSGNVEIENSTYLVNNAANSNLVIPDTASVTLDAGTTMQFVWGDEAFDALSGQGAIVRNTADNQGIRTLTLGASGGSGNFSGTIGTGFNIVKAGAGTQVFSGANSYTGTTTVSGGVLEAVTPASLPGYNVSGKITVAPGAMLAVNC